MIQTIALAFCLHKVEELCGVLTRGEDTTLSSAPTLGRARHSAAPNRVALERRGSYQASHAVKNWRATVFCFIEVHMRVHTALVV